MPEDNPMNPIEAINTACSPDATKALFMGECGVSWSAFKDVQRAILEQARLNWAGHAADAGAPSTFCGCVTMGAFPAAQSVSLSRPT